MATGAPTPKAGCLLLDLKEESMLILSLAMTSRPGQWWISVCQLHKERGVDLVLLVLLSKQREYPSKCRYLVNVYGASTEVKVSRIIPGGLSFPTASSRV